MRDKFLILEIDLPIAAISQKLHLLYDMLTVKRGVYNADFKQIYNGNPYVCLHRYIFGSEDD